MARRFICAAVVTLVAFGVAMAEEFTASITKVEDGKITFKKFKGKGEKAEEATLAVAANVKYLKGKASFADMKFTVEADGNLEGGKEAFEKLVKEAAAKKPDDKDKDKKKKGFGGFGGVFAQIVTEGEGDKAKVTEIRVLQGKGKKKDAQ